MKKLIIIIGVLLMAGTSVAELSPVTVSAADMQKDIAEYIRTGNVSQLAKLFNANLDLTVPGNDNTYSKTQAEIILKDFFSKFPPQAFKVNHNGSSRDGSLYLIGTYTSRQGKSFRTYCLIKKAGDKYVIQQLQFESE